MYRPLAGLKAFSITIATTINDLPTTSPPGRWLNHPSRIVRVVSIRTARVAQQRHTREDVSILESFVRSFAEWIGRRNTKPESTRRRFKD